MKELMGKFFFESNSQNWSVDSDQVKFYKLKNNIFLFAFKFIKLAF